MHDVFRSIVLAISCCIVHQFGPVSAPQLIEKDLMHSCADARDCDSVTTSCTLPTITDLLADADDKLFESILANSEHILHNSIGLPERARPSHHHHLRPRKHSKELIPKTRISSTTKTLSFVCYIKACIRHRHSYTLYSCFNVFT